MGSKTKILPFVLDGIDEVYRGGVICDLFSGSCSLAGAIGTQAPIISNDIQSYSAVIGKAYLTDWYDSSFNAKTIIEIATNYHNKNFKQIVKGLAHQEANDLLSFNKIESLNKELISKEFNNKWHLFTKYYSGTWWSAEQCSWIDSLRKAIEDFNDNPAYNTMLASLMYAMAYNSQGTGHYAQYRDAKTDSSMKDILIYRRKSILEYFERKLESALLQMRKKPSEYVHKVYTLDYMDCLEKVKNATIYADPPYCFVHYSRFYHAIETLVLYDYPRIQHKNNEMVKGRYREDRHQSPFSIRSKVKGAFADMFSAISDSNSSLVLSYSNTGMIDIEELLQLSNEIFTHHTVKIKSLKHLHMTMGRKDDRNRTVKEKLIIVKPL
ncbi:restriction endonuclease [Puteibacter caeruleilacunae]|nr:restriction endonuclease [Puteibacter caeruleilacunae]